MEERRGLTGDWNVGESFRGSGEDENALNMLPAGEIVQTEGRSGNVNQ